MRTVTVKKALGPIITGLLLFLSLLAWAFASPVGASPDEDFHLASIWCGAGERQSLCEAGDSPETRLVPDAAVESAACYAMRSDISAECQGIDYLDGEFELVESDRLNADGTYPSGYYFVASLFTGDNLVISTLMIRVFNAFLFSVLVLITWVAIPRDLKFALSGSIALTFVPLGLFLVASVNPSSWGLLSGALIVPAMLGFFRTSGRQQFLLGVLSTVAVLLAATTRGDSALFAGLGLFAACLIELRRTKSFLLRLLLPVSLGLLAAIAFLSAGQSSSAFDPDANPYAGEQTGLSLLFSNTMNLPGLWVGIWGHGWGLGWFDTGIPPLVSIPLIAAASGGLLIALRTISLRKGIVLILVASALVVVPLLVLQQNGAHVGEFIQPRYLLPLVTMLLAFALSPDRATASPNWQMSQTQLTIIAAVLACANSVSLYINIGRYVGASGLILDLDYTWWWNTAISPLSLWAVGSLAFATLLVVWVKSSLRSAPTPSVGFEPQPTFTQ